MKKKSKKKVVKKKIFKTKKKKSKKKISRKKSIKKISKSKSRPHKIIKRTLKESQSFLRKLKVIKKLPRIGTGISNFDKMIEGGFERESINLIVGGSGSGKSIFGLQFLIEGVKKGESVLYVSFEEKKREFFSNMKKFGWDLNKLEKTGKFIFLEYSPEKVKMMLDEGGGTIESLVLKHKISRMVIDSITSFSLLFDDALSKRQANLGLFDIIDKWSCTTLLTVQHDPLKRKGKELSTIEFEADSITLLYFIKEKAKRKRYIEVLKMRGTNHSKDTHLFEIKKDGIKIGRKANIKKKSNK